MRTRCSTSERSKHTFVSRTLRTFNRSVLHQRQPPLSSLRLRGSEEALPYLHRCQNRKPCLAHRQESVRLSIDKASSLTRARASADLLEYRPVAFDVVEVAALRVGIAVVRTDLRAFAEHSAQHTVLNKDRTCVGKSLRVFMPK